MTLKKFAQRYKSWKRENKKLRHWKASGYALPAPQTVKQGVLLRNALPDGLWVETGTYVGTTTQFLAEHYNFVHTIEPAEIFYQKAVKKFMGMNVNVHHGSSEQVMPELLKQLSGNANFWLDGHYSGGETFYGDQECPIIDELDAIRSNRANLNKITIFIDDIRCFYPDTLQSGYPLISYLTNWSEENGMTWRIEHDIMVIR